MATAPAFNPNAPYSIPAFDPNKPYDVAPKHDFSSLTANPKGEGTYQIKTADGQTVAVPYSNVPVFTQGLQGSSFASPDEQARFAKDAAADPQRPSFWNALTNPVGSGAHAQGVVGGAEQVGGQAIKTMAQPILHPIDTIEGLGKVAADALVSPTQAGVDVVAPVMQQYAQDKQRGGTALAAENLAGQVAGNVEGGRTLGAAASGVEPSAALPAGVNRLVPEAVAKGVLPSAWDWGTGAAKGAISGDVNATIPGTDVTPAERYASLKKVGVQPNAAEATNSTPLNIAEKVNQNSLTAAPTYAQARAANIKALNDYAEDVLSKMSPMGAEEGGAAVQQGLRTAQANLQNQAAQGYLNLDRQVGARKLPGAGLQQTAKFIHDQNVDYYTQHPELVPTNAWKIVKDLAGADTTPPFQARPMSFGELHQLRSDLLEIVRTNPDIVKNQAGGWLQKLAEAADDTMTNGGKGMTPAQLAVYRDANQAWANMKNTYDSPQNPIYHAVRSSSPSTLVTGIAQTPEMAKTLQSALGPEGMGPIQRGVAEKLLGSTKEGGYNFRTFQGKFNKLPEAYRNALFTPEQVQQLDDLGNAGTLLHEDANPSGSARLGQGIAEAGELARSIGNPHEMAGNLAYHAAHYGFGKLMNSPTFVDWLMRGRGFSPVGEATAPAGSRLVPAAIVGGALPSAWDWRKNEPKQ